MSNRDELTRLKNNVEVYEKELRDTLENLLPSYNESDIESVAIFNNKFAYAEAKLIKAYRKYVEALEKLIPG
jgi:hypothetical protein